MSRASAEGRMDDSGFWNVIEAADRDAAGDCVMLVDLVGEQLKKLSAAEIQSFDALLRDKLRSAYSWSLWGAAYLIYGGCSDDGFEYFRCWLISQGRAVFDAALAHPDSLADVVDPGNDYHECEALLYIARQVYGEVTGQPMPAGKSNYPRYPMGESWDFDDEAATAEQLPRLSLLYAR
jgi:hypothetical protein